MITCPNCQTQNNDTARFCIRCASPLVASLSCPSCGTTNSPQAHFCQHCAAPLRGATPPGLYQTGMLPPQTVLQSRYNIVGTIGRGGMGAVYETADLRIPGKHWAVKELSDAALTTPQEKQNAIAAFRQEAQMLATLSHPNLPVVSDFFSEGAKHYLVMEYVQGETLEDKLYASVGFLPEAQVLEWIGQICDVLAYLHSRKPPVIFRDLKPSNIMVDSDGRVKLIDFGIARFFKAGKASDTQAMGTPGYAAPEQFGTGQTDARSDVYSLGILLHQLLTRYEPWTTPFNLPPPLNINPAISQQAAAVIHRAIQPSPADRFQTIRELRQALTGLAPAIQALSPQPPTPQPQPIQPSLSPPQPVQPSGTPLSPLSAVQAPAVVTPLTPAEVAIPGSRPRWVTISAWTCILTGFDLLGIIAGIAMFKGKSWGRTLGMIHIGLLITISVFILTGKGDPRVYTIPSYIALILLGVFLGCCWATLFHAQTVEWFTPGRSRASLPPRGIKIVGIWNLVYVIVDYLFLHVFLWVGLILVPAGIGLLLRKRWAWMLAEFEAWLLVLIGMIALQQGVSSYDRVLTGPSALIILVFTWIAIYLLRKDVRLAFGLGKP